MQLWNDTYLGRSRKLAAVAVGESEVKSVQGFAGCQPPS